jgi:transcriptional regulator of met regulon
MLSHHSSRCFVAALRCFIDARNQVLSAKVSIPLEHLHRLVSEASRFQIDKIRKQTATSIAHAASIEMYTPFAVDAKA